MAKGQKRGNREPKKPKQTKKPPSAVVAGLSPNGDPVRLAFAKRPNGAKSHR